MQINITNLETKMCSNTFNEQSITTQLERQFGKFDANGIVQVNFKEVKNSGLYQVSIKFEQDTTSFSSNASATTASKAFGQAKAKLSAQVEKQRSVKKCGKRSPKDEVKKLLEEQE